MTAEALEDLRHHWGEAYVIWHVDGFGWFAVPRSGPVDEPLHSETPAEMRALIRADYAGRPAPEPGDFRPRPSGPCPTDQGSC